MNNLNIIFAILIGYWLLVIFLDKHGILERYNITTFGPVLMIRTRRGQKLLEMLARPRRFWKFFGDVGIPVMLVGMFIMLMLVILTDYTMLQSLYNHAMPAPERYNAPQNIFLIPGLNEFIPLVWGVIGLVITLVVHELAHAVLCKVEGVDVKSMGLLTLIVPIGGFAEPDEEQLFGKKEESTKSATESGYDWQVSEIITVSNGISRKSRMRILVAGVMANFVVALIAFSLFFGPVVGGIAPVSGVVIASVEENSSAAQAGIKEGMAVTKVDNTTIRTVHDFYTYMAARTDTPMVISVQEGQTHKTCTIAEQDATMRGGVTIWRVMPDSAAARANLTEGMNIIQINDTRISNTTDFVAFLNTTVPNQTVEVFFADNNRTIVKLGSSPDRSCGYMGVIAVTRLEFAGMTIGGYPAAERLHILKNIPDMMHRIEGWLFVFAMPFIGFDGSGFSGFSNTMQFYEPVGWAAGHGILVFWIANALLWTGWINFYAGLFNCLPAVPMDGGHIFRDVIHSLFGRVVSDRGAEQLSKGIAAAFAILILVSFVFMILGPYIVHGFQ